MLTVSLLLATVAVVLTGAAPPAYGQSAGADEPACEVEYVVLEPNLPAFSALVVVRPLTTPISYDYYLEWTFPAGQQLTQVWNGQIQRPGGRVEVYGTPGRVEIGGSTSIRFEALWDGANNPAPIDFALEGEPCVVTTPTPYEDCGQGTFDSEVIREGEVWYAYHRGVAVFRGLDLGAAIRAGIAALTPRRTSVESVVVRDSGYLDLGEPVGVPSFTRLESCGIITTRGSGETPILVRRAERVEIPFLRLRAPRASYGLLLRAVSDVRLGRIEVHSADTGIRVEGAGSTDVRLEHADFDDLDYGLDTDGLDGLRVGTVIDRGWYATSVRLGATTNVEIRTIDSRNTAGDATAFDFALRLHDGTGRIGRSYPENIRVGTIIARQGYRGLQCDGLSGGLVVDRLDLMAAYGPGFGVSVRDCRNVTLVADYGTVVGERALHVGSFTSTPVADVSIRNLRAVDADLIWMPCEGTNVRLYDVTLENTNLFWCVDSLPEP